MFHSLNPAGALSDTPFLISTVPSGQAGPASGPDRTQTATTFTMDMVSPLEHLYQESDPEPVFAQPASTVPVSSLFQQSVESLPVVAQNISPPDQVEEGELSELEDQPEQDNSDHAVSEDQNSWDSERCAGFYGMVAHSWSWIFPCYKSG